MDMIRHAVKGDKVYRNLNEAIRNGIKSKDQGLSPYLSVWNELSVIKGVVQDDRVADHTHRVGG